MDLDITHVKEAVTSGRKDIDGIIDFITEKSNKADEVAIQPMAAGVVLFYKLTTSEETCYKTHDSSGTIRFNQN